MRMKPPLLRAQDVEDLLAVSSQFRPAYPLTAGNITVIRPEHRRLQL
jgi:hypothetical protein